MTQKLKLALFVHVRLVVAAKIGLNKVIEDVDSEGEQQRSSI